MYRFNDGAGNFTYTGRHNPCPWGDEVGDGERYYDINDQPCTAADDACSKTLRGCTLRFKDGMDLETSGSQSITSITRVDTVATVTTSGNHNKTFGMFVTISGADQPEYNGAFIVLGTPTATTFTIVVSGSPATPATGTISMVGDARPRHALPFNGFPGIRSPGEA